MHPSAVLLVLMGSFRSAVAFLSPTTRPHVPCRRLETRRFLSSFYESFDDEEDEEEEEEEEDDDEFNDLDVANFRTRMSSLFQPDDDDDSIDTAAVDELIGLATHSPGSTQDDWARPVDTITPGTILLANPKYFCSDFAGTSPNPELLSRFGLSAPPPIEVGPDRRADLLPVLLIVDSSPSQGTRAILLNRRTGHLLGDLEQPFPEDEDDESSTSTPLLAKFCIQPLWFGGVDSYSAGLEMVHLCPAVQGAKQLTEDGLYFGGDPTQAQDAMTDSSLERPMSGFDFKFFVQSTLFSPNELEQQVASSIFFRASVSTPVIFKSRDRMGTKRAKPLWTEIMELMGGEYATTRNQLYEDDYRVDFNPEDYL